MAGHSQFKNIMHRKGAQDAKRAKIFTKIVREIIASLGGGAQTDPGFNPRLRTAIDKARSVNMPKDRIENAIAKGSGTNSGENFDEIRYEGYGPGGSAIIVEALTDNRNRTASEVRSTFSKAGGQLGESGSVSFMFDHVGQIVYVGANLKPEDELMEVALDAGASDFVTEDEAQIIYTEIASFHTVLDALKSKFSDPDQAEIIWKPQSITEISGEAGEKLNKIIDTLEDLDDVQNVYCNYAAAE